MIYFSANTRKATAHTDDDITTRSVGIPVKLVLSSEFDGLAKTLCAKNGTAAVDVVLVGDDTTATIPPDVLLTTGQLQIGIYAADAAGNIVIPTVWALVGNVKPGAIPSGIEPDAPAPSWAAQVQSIASEALEKANEVKQAAENGEFDGATGPEGPQGPTGKTPVFSIGTVDTLPAGSPASAKIGGTTEAPVLNLGIPQGEQGIPGEVQYSDVASVFDTTASYSMGDYVFYQGQLYCFTAEHAAGAWIGTDAVAAKVADDVAGLKSQIKQIDNTVDGIQTRTDIAFTPNAYINNNASVGATVTLTPTANRAFSYAIVNCSAGDVIHLHGYGWTNGRLWAFIDENDNLISKADASYDARTGLDLIAPTGSAKLIINSYTSDLGACWFGTSRTLADLYALGTVTKIVPILPSDKGGFVASNGTIANNSGYSYTAPIEVKTGDVLEYVLVGISTVYVVAVTDADGNYNIPIIAGEQSLSIKRYSIDFDGYIRLSYSVAAGWNYAAIIYRSSAINAAGDSVYQYARQVGTKRFLSNPHVGSMSHQGVQLGHGKNSMSAFWGAYLKGFNTLLCNIRFTSDHVPICSHDATYTDSISGNTITIETSTYEQIAATKRRGEAVPKFEDVVYFAKCLGLGVTSANSYPPSDTEDWAAIWEILDKYRMTEHMTWLAGNATIATYILTHNPRQKIMFYLSTFTAEGLAELVNYTNTVAETYPDSTFILWIPAAGVNIDDFCDALETENQRLKPNVKMGICNVETTNYVRLLPLCDYFHSDSIATCDMTSGMIDHLMEKYPQLVPYADYNFVLRSWYPNMS